MTSIFHLFLSVSIFMVSSMVVHPPKEPMLWGTKSRNAYHGLKTALRRTIRVPPILAMNLLTSHSVSHAQASVAGIAAQVIIIPFPLFFGILHTPRDLWKRRHGEFWDPTMRNYHHYNLDKDRQYLVNHGISIDSSDSIAERLCGKESIITMMSMSQLMLVESGSKGRAERAFFANLWIAEVHMAIALKEWIQQISDHQCFEHF